MWKDVREWLDEAKKLGQLKIIKGADTKLEVSAISQVNAKNNGPALLFEDLKGFEGTGFRVLTDSICNPDLFNLTIGNKTGISVRETITSLKGKPNQWASKSENYQMEYVEDAPFLKNISGGENVDLFKFPTPLWHDLDGGRFIGTGVAVITQDPDTKFINVGAYRAQLHEKNKVGVNIGAGKHGSYPLRKYAERGEKMPIVMVVGPDPLLYLLSGSEIPLNVSELNYQGAVTGKPTKVVKGKLTGLPIPADAEIVLEGFVYPGEKEVEGPHGEWTGYYASIPREKPYATIERLYHRDDPILLGASMSKGSSNDHAFWRSIWKSALVYDELETNGVTGIEGVYMPPFGVGRQFLVVSVKQSYPGHATEVGYLSSQTRSAAYMGKWVVVVDDDVDPFDMDDVLWAVCSRADPSEMGIIKNAWGWDNWGKRTNSRAIIFATTPYDKLNEDKVTGKTCFITRETGKKTFDKWSSEMDGRWKTF